MIAREKTTLMYLRLSTVLFATALLTALPQTASTGEDDAAPVPDAEVAAPALQPEVLNDASRYRTRAQQMVLDLASAGETDLDELVALILADHSEVLDYIVINLAEQKLYECNVNGDVLSETPISSGTRGYETPPGEYNVVNKAPKAYREKYEAWMLHWLGLTADGGYGIHGLEGSSYERLLGRVASHGCIRISRDYARELYSRVHVGLPVRIVNDPELDLRQYEPLSHQAAVALVLEALSPADPWEIYY
jgi:lipoprotein-anchoring transpeptidase ErfK/SrfK